MRLMLHMYIMSSFEPQFPYYKLVENPEFTLNAMPATVEELQGLIPGLSEVVEGLKGLCHGLLAYIGTAKIYICVTGNLQIMVYSC